MSHKLLLADDSATIAKILGMALQSEAYSIKSVATADEAVKELKENTPFFFLVDLTLPAKNGYEFSKMIRSNAKLSDVRVVLLSSAFDPIDLNLFQDCGADLFIEKPFDPADLRLKLQQLANQPPKFPAGTNVQGAISGTAVQTKTDINLRAPDTAAAPSLGSAVPSLESLLSSDSAPTQDANSILENLLTSNTGDSPPPFASAPEPVREAPSNPSMATIQLDKNPSEGIATKKQEPVLDLSQEFNQKTTMLEAGGDAAELFNTPALEPMDQGLSANALALAEFFAAEIENKKAESALSKTMEINLPTPSSESLAGWSQSAAPEQRPANRIAPAAPAAAPVATNTPITGPRASAGASLAGSAMFDTGGSNFRFADDYIDRITQAFSGDVNEAEITRPQPTPVFPTRSDDSAPQTANAATPLGGGAWSSGDIEKIEGIVRQEVQTAVREVLEKVAWEIIPELAENLIKKELEKVMKELEAEG